MKNYATQMDAAKRGIVTPEMETVARKENRAVDFIMERVARGTVAIPANVNHASLSAEGIGDGLRVKINVNLGISGDAKDYDLEMRKVDMAVADGRGIHYGSVQLRENQYLPAKAARRFTGHDWHRANVRRDRLSREGLA